MNKLQMEILAVILHWSFPSEFKIDGVVVVVVLAPWG